jgi:uncharacterized membrane protein YdjX (TVP38/TMEM64 family)
MHHKPSTKKILTWLLTLAIVIGISYFLQRVLWTTYIYDAFQANYVLGVLLLVVLKASTIILAPLSGSVIYILAGTLLPGWESIFWLSVGNFVGITTAYFLGRRYGDRIVARFFGDEWIKQTHELIDRLHEWKSFLVVRIVFFGLEDLINYVAGMSRLSYLPFIIISMIITTCLMLFIINGVSRVAGFWEVGS